MNKNIIHALIKYFSMSKGKQKIETDPFPTLTIS